MSCSPPIRRQRDFAGLPRDGRIAEPRLGRFTEASLSKPRLGAIKAELPNSF
jgi:hypothetical protein